MTEARVAPINSALISVSDKSGVVPFAQALAAQGVKILSTGGTCRLLLSAVSYTHLTLPTMRTV